MKIDTKNCIRKLEGNGYAKRGFFMPFKKAVSIIGVTPHPPMLSIFWRRLFLEKWVTLIKNIDKYKINVK